MKQVNIDLVGIGTEPTITDGKANGFNITIIFDCEGERKSIGVHSGEDQLKLYQNSKSWKHESVSCLFANMFKYLLGCPAPTHEGFKNQVINIDHIINVIRLKIPFLVHKACNRETFYQYFKN